MAGALKVWDGTAWQTVGSNGKPASNTYVGPSAPPGPQTAGDLWYDTDEVSGLTLPITLANGGTGGTSAATARASLTVPAIGSSGSATGPPTSGTFVKGDQWMDSSNATWICTVAGTPGTWASLSTGEELFYTELTSGQVTIAVNSEAAPQQIFTSGARTYDGSPVWIEAFFPRVDTAANGQLLLLLWDASTNLGWIAQNLYPSQQGYHPNFIQRKLTPTVGSHTYRIMAWALTGTASVWGSTGTTGVHVPAYMRIRRA